MKPTEASPETKEQFETHESLSLYQGEKTFLPPNSKMSLGLALPHMSFNKILITTTIVADKNNPKQKNKKYFEKKRNNKIQQSTRYGRYIGENASIYIYNYYI